MDIDINKITPDQITKVDDTTVAVIQVTPVTDLVTPEGKVTGTIVKTRNFTVDDINVITTLANNQIAEGQKQLDGGQQLLASIASFKAEVIKILPDQPIKP